MKSDDKRLMARRLISLPKKLHAAMADHPTVNWSLVARNAFRKKLKAIRRGGQPG